jgi:hypothetical protein
VHSGAAVTAAPANVAAAAPALDAKLAPIGGTAGGALNATFDRRMETLETSATPTSR